MSMKGVTYTPSSKIWQNGTITTPTPAPHRSPYTDDWVKKWQERNAPKPYKLSQPIIIEEKRTQDKYVLIGDDGTEYLAARLKDGGMVSIPYNSLLADFVFVGLADNKSIAVEKL